jgi:ribosomal protein L30/L7E
MPDTEDEDSAAEAFWPEGYKEVIREEVRRAVLAQLTGKKRFHRVYRNGYSESYPSYEDFIAKVADMVAIGAENGADDAFDEIMDSFLEEEALPALWRYTSYSWPDALPRGVREKLRQSIIDEYSQDDVYLFAYKAGYKNDFRSVEEYINRVAELVEVGVKNGAEDALEQIYRSFINLDRLRPVRRYPRRLKMWQV